MAAAAPVPVFVVGGAAGGDAESLRLDRRIRMVASPRHATILLATGRLPQPLRRPAALVHDALAHPRATLWWGDGQPDVEWLGDCPRVPLGGDAAGALVRVHAELLSGRRASDVPVVTATTRQGWDGFGPFGQGGQGMTGGTPYGRPLADRELDVRDGLTLDVLPLVVGPFFPAFPVGLTVEVSLQGDVVTQAGFAEDPFVQTGPGARTDAEAVFARAAAEPVPVADLERARIAVHLRFLSRMLRLHGLDALSLRALALAVAARPSPRQVHSLLATVERTGLDRVLGGVGAVPADAVAGKGLGVVARAGGLPEDARSDDPAYQGLGFAAITQDTGDARSRLRQRVAEARQSLHLVERAGDRARGPGLALEDPRTSLEAAGPLLVEALMGAEWGDAVATIVSFDLALGVPAGAPSRVGAA